MFMSEADTEKSSGPRAGAQSVQHYPWYIIQTVR